MFTESDKQLMQHKGIDMPLIEKQLNRFNIGFPWLKIQAVATVGNGIKRMDDNETAQCVNTWKTFQQQGGSILKFVPASGAASRMFKNIFAFISSGRDLAETDFEKQFIAGIDKFAFYHDLNKVCMALYGHDIRTLVAAGKHVLVAKALLEPSGLNYGAL
ncbi:MAG: DUF4301 family protein, partial [Muribaculaceae bacterium]|nr:DUF4301 family protein [Muribaculaceae bacterium]